MGCESGEEEAALTVSSKASNTEGITKGCRDSVLKHVILPFLCIWNFSSLPFEVLLLGDVRERNFFIWRIWGQSVPRYRFTQDRRREPRSTVKIIIFRVRDYLVITGRRYLPLSLSRHWNRWLKRPTPEMFLGKVVRVFLGNLFNEGSRRGDKCLAFWDNSGVSSLMVLGESDIQTFTKSQQLSLYQDLMCTFLSLKNKMRFTFLSQGYLKSSLIGRVMFLGHSSFLWRLTRGTRKIRLMVWGLKLAQQYHPSQICKAVQESL